MQRSEALNIQAFFHPMKVNEHNLQSLTVGHSESLKVQVNPEDVIAFARLCGDDSPLHVDETFARSRGHRSCVAHGMLIGAYVSALIGTKLPGRLGMMQSCELQFRAPLIPPATLTVTGEVTRISTGTGQVALKVTVTNAAGDLLVTGKVTSIISEPNANPLS